MIADEGRVSSRDSVPPKFGQGEVQELLPVVCVAHMARSSFHDTGKALLSEDINSCLDGIWLARADYNAGAFRAQTPCDFEADATS